MSSGFRGRTADARGASVNRGSPPASYATAPDIPRGGPVAGTKVCAGMRVSGVQATGIQTATLPVPCGSKSAS